MRIVSPDRTAGLYLSRVKRTRRQPEPERLESLARQAADYALHMPRNKTSAREAVGAKAALLKLGMTVVNRGFDPGMN